jgi:hypothetical protein
LASAAEDMTLRNICFNVDGSVGFIISLREASRHPGKKMLIWDSQCASTKSLVLVNQSHY